MLYDFPLPLILPLTCHSQIFRWQHDGNLFHVFPLYHVNNKLYTAFFSGKLNLSPCRLQWGDHKDRHCVAKYSLPCMSTYREYGN